MSHSQLLKGLRSAVIDGMRIVRYGQGKATEASVKADDTLVTPTDKRSQAAMLHRLAGIPDITVWAEESAPPATDDGPDIVVIVDPMDGTSAFANGLATSTVIAAAYSRSRKTNFACVIGEAATGRIWQADERTATKLVHLDYRNGDSYSGNAIEVGKEWSNRTRNGNASDYIFLDVAHNFVKGLNVAQMTAILGSLVKAGIKFHVPGSNGLIHALVANGAKIAAGSISTAKGGPWDFAGALLVKQAGGFVRGFRKDGERIVEHDALDPFGCDFLVTANSSAILAILSETLLAAY